MKRRQVFRAQASKTQSSSSVRRFTNSGPVLSFNPASIAGCQLWLDAADSSSILMDSSSNVSLWIDKSGNGNTVTQDTSANQPTYVTNVVNGNPVIRFNGTSHVLQTTSFTSLGTNSVSFWLVERNLSNLGGGGAPFSFNSGPNNGIVFQNNNGLQPLPNSVPYTSSVARIVFYNRTNTGSGDTTYLNGTVVTTRDDNTTGTYGTTFAVGMRILSTIYTSGDICEILIFIGMPTTTQRQKVEGYLANKWGLKSSLPSNHPYKSIAPTYEQPVFVPTLISGSQLWLDGEDTSSMTLSGSSVTSWADKSGNNRNTTNSVFSSPTLQNQTVTFTGTNGLRFSTTFPNFYDIFAVAAPLSSTDSWRTLLQVAEGTASHIVLVEAGSTRLGSWYGGFRQFGSLTWSGTKSLLFARLNSNLTMNASLNGTETLTSDTDAVGAASSATINLGNAVGSGQPWGDLNEFLLFNPPLTLQQRKRVEGYLAQKWGLHSFLPVNHPYKTIAPTGIPKSITIQSVSALFNNSSITVPSNSSVTLGTNNHTIEFWLYQTSRGLYDCPFQYSTNTSAFSTNSYYMAIGGYIGILIGNGSGGFTVNMGSTVSLPSLNTWHHYAIVRNGTTFTLYINGISRETATSSINITAQAGSFIIGDVSTTTNTPLFGYITNFRLVNGTAVYTSNFTPPTSPLTAIPNTQILIQGLVDRSPNAFTVTNNGSTALSTTISPFV